VFGQQSLQPKLSRRCYASVSYALQNNTVFSLQALDMCSTVTFLSFRNRCLVFEDRFRGELLLQSVSQLQQSFFFLINTQHTAMTMLQTVEYYDNSL